MFRTIVGLIGISFICIINLVITISALKNRIHKIWSLVIIANFIYFSLFYDMTISSEHMGAFVSIIYFIIQMVFAVVVSYIFLIKFLASKIGYRLTILVFIL